jgi:probable phosphoglycerate mutase
MKILTIFTDGASRGNPGLASCGFVIYENDKLITEQGIKLGTQTNNFAEYHGVIKAFQWVLDNYGKDVPIQFKMDSLLVASQMTGKWKIKHEVIRSLYFTAKNLEKEFPSVTYQHVAREENKEADRMANFALDNP